MAVSTDVQEGPCDLELSLDAPSLMPFPSSPGKDHGFFFFYVLTHIQHPHLDPPAGQDGARQARLGSGILHGARALLGENGRTRRDRA